LCYVKVIWYEPAPDVESTALFTPPQHRPDPAHASRVGEGVAAQGVGRGRRASLRRIEMGMQWDVIERV
jgi:hypothetical protein